MRRFIVFGLLAGFSGSAFSAPLVFDSISGAPALRLTGGTPRFLMGQAMNLGNVSSGPVQVVGMDFMFAATTAATYSSIRFDISFFNTASLANTGTTAAFTGLIASYAATLSNFTTAANTAYTIQGATPGVTPGLSFGTPFSFTNTSNVGVQMLVRGDTGTGLVGTNNLTFVVRTDAPFAVGANSAGTPGFWYRNASQTAPTNAQTSLLGSDARTLVDANSVAYTNQGLGVRLYTVPEPTSVAVLGLGVAALLRRRRK